MEDELITTDAFTNLGKDLASGIEALDIMQVLVSGKVPGAICGAGEWPTKEAVRTYTLALMVEVAEWVQTLDYKAWKNTGPDASLNAPALQVADEFADILAFLGILITYMRNWGIDADAIADAYIRKSIVNWDRLTHQFPDAGA